MVTVSVSKTAMKFLIHSQHGPRSPTETRTFWMNHSDTLQNHYKPFRHSHEFFPVMPCTRSIRYARTRSESGVRYTHYA